MGTLLRTAKSGSDWTAHELRAYDIAIVPQTKAQFFGTSEALPDPTEPSLSGFMINESRQAATDDKTKQLLHFLDLAMNSKPGLDTAVINFTAELLKSLGYHHNDRIIFVRRTIPLLICGENSVAQIDVCVMDDNEILLLLQGDKRLTGMEDPEPPLIAGAIAAFALNNKSLERNNLPTRDTIMFPAITMAGTTPTFYKITVTTTLSNAVQSGAYPEIETRVFRYIPALPCRNSDGMRLLPNRLEILRLLEAFKAFLGN